VERSTESSREPVGLVRRACNWWHEVPLPIRTTGAAVLGVALGGLLGPRAVVLRQPADLTLRLLHAASPVLVLLALALMLADADIRGRTWLRMAGLLSLNTAIAAAIGLLVGNVLRPGRWSAHPAAREPVVRDTASWSEFFHHLPTNLSDPLARHDVLTALVLAMAIGFALRKVKRERHMEGEAPYDALEAFGTVVRACIAVLLGWLLDLLPFVLLGVTAGMVGEHGLGVFVSLGPLVLAALLGLTLQVGYYLLRVRLETCVRPQTLLRGGSDALLTAFSSASSTTAMPIAYACLQERVGLPEEAAGMGALVGANVSKDGTILYLALATLFVAQMQGLTLGLRTQAQLLLVLASLVARVTPGVPGAGFATLTVATSAIHLPLDIIPLLLTVDWLLDRCRSTVNVLGHMTVSCLLHGKGEPGPAK
jgi:Na+/H+-dicarboxylate symporter